MNTTFHRTSTILVSALLAVGCATSKKYVENDIISADGTEKEITHSFYLLGGYDANQESTTNVLLKKAQEDIQKAKVPSTVLFMGDYGDDATVSIDAQMNLTEVAGMSYFLLGEEEWSSKNTDTIDELEDYVESKDMENVKLEPENTCPLERIRLSDDLDMIIINSTWLISDWNRIRVFTRAARISSR